MNYGGGRWVGSNKLVELKKKKKRKREMHEGKVLPGRNLAFLEFKEHSLKTRKSCPLSRGLP